MKYYLSGLKKFAVFHGRATRREYWYFVLFNLVFSFVSAFLDRMFGTTFQVNVVQGSIDLGYGYIYLLYNLAAIIPSLSVLVRRLHDVGKSAWYFFILLIPIVGLIWILVLLFGDSVYGMNEYGPNSKGLGNRDEIDEIGNYLTE